MEALTLALFRKKGKFQNNGQNEGKHEYGWSRIERLVIE